MVFISFSVCMSPPVYTRVYLCICMYVDVGMEAGSQHWTSFSATIHLLFGGEVSD